MQLGQPWGSARPLAQSRETIFRGDRMGTGSEFSPLYDAFHGPFPLSAEKYILAPIEALSQSNERHSLGHKAATMSNDIRPNTSCDETNVDGDPIFRLPVEVSDLVLSYLSPAALDAARHTCKFWRQKILSNRWVLSTVLNRTGQGVPHALRLPSPSTTPDEVKPLVSMLSYQEPTLRDLLKRLDQDSDLVSTQLEPDTWRTRFRIRTLEFSTEASRTLPSPNLSMTGAARVGSQSGLLVFRIAYPDALVESGSTLIFYCLDSDDFPQYAGFAKHPGVDGKLDIIDMVQTKSKQPWVLKIGIGDHVGLFSITSRNSFSKFGARFSVTELGSLDDIKQSGSMKDIELVLALHRTPEILSKSNGLRKVLALFPDNEGVSASSSLLHEPAQLLSNIISLQLHHVCYVEGVRQHGEPRYLAEHVSSGNVIVVKGSDHHGSSTRCLDDFLRNGEQYLCGTALLVRPRSDCIYRNIAIAPVATRYGTIRVAIIWQSRFHDKSRSELHIYDVPEAVYYEPCSSYSASMASDRDQETVEDLANFRMVHGKRVTSLDYQTGGIHPLSPLWNVESTEAIKPAYENQAAQGGLQLPHSVGNSDTYPKNTQYQKCFVWGPKSENESTSIECKVFDFSFADSQRLRLLTFAGVQTRHRQDGAQYMPTLNQLHCACALHDDEYHIVLPSIQNPGNNSEESQNPLKAISSLFWPWNRKDALSGDENVGSITRNDSIARQKAFERRNEWFKERIRSMRRAGLSHFEMAELWGCARWTRWGQVRKPDGWKEL